jgi:hypothetical protein
MISNRHHSIASGKGKRERSMKMTDRSRIEQKSVHIYKPKGRVSIGERCL